MLSKKSGRQIDKRGTWPLAISSLLFSVLIILTIRWALLEPYIIPSGSMVPTLLIHDHIFVNKFAYGIRVPFSQKWLLQFNRPNRGEIVVFKSVEDTNIFLIKRVVGLPGDEIEITDRTLKINGVQIDQREASESEMAPFLLRTHDGEKLSDEHQFKFEKLDSFEHVILYWKPKEDFTSEVRVIKVPEGHYFMMGDNRDHSGDSRMWGSLPFENILGRASLIWLSCEKMAEGSSRICDFSTLRTERLFSKVR